MWRWYPEHDKIIKKITKAVISRYENMSEEQKKECARSLTGKKNPNYRHGMYTKEAIKQKSVEWQNKTHEEKYAHLIGQKPWNKGLKTGPTKPWTLERRKHMREINKNKEGRKIVCEGILYKNLHQAANVYGISVSAVVQRVNSKTNLFREFYDYNEDDANIYEIYDENKIEYYRNKSSVYKVNPRERLIFCEGKIMNIAEARKYYGFNSSSAIVHRCKSEKFKDFYYIR